MRPDCIAPGVVIPDVGSVFFEGDWDESGVACSSEKDLGHPLVGIVIHLVLCDLGVMMVVMVARGKVVWFVVVVVVVVVVMGLVVVVVVVFVCGFVVVWLSWLHSL